MEKLTIYITPLAHLPTCPYRRQHIMLTSYSCVVLYSILFNAASAALALLAGNEGRMLYPIRAIKDPTLHSSPTSLLCATQSRFAVIQCLILKSIPCPSNPSKNERNHTQ